MNINKVSDSLSFHFDYQYYDDAGELQTEQITGKVKRLSFRKITAEKFKEASSRTAEHPEEIANILAESLDKWNLFTDDIDPEGSMLEITADTIADREPNFVMGLSTAVFEKLFPNFQTAEQSPNGSAQTEKSTAVQS